MKRTYCKDCEAWNTEDMELEDMGFCQRKSASEGWNPTCADRWCFDGVPKNEVTYSGFKNAARKKRASKIIKDETT